VYNTAARVVSCLDVVLSSRANQAQVLHEDGLRVLGRVVLPSLPSSLLTMELVHALDAMLLHLATVDCCPTGGTYSEGATNTANAVSPSSTADNTPKATSMLGPTSPLDVLLPPLPNKHTALFDHLLLHSVFNMSMWTKPGVDTAVQANIARLAQSWVDAHPRFVRALVPMEHIMEDLRLYLPYTSLCTALSDLAKNGVADDLSGATAAAAAGGDGGGDGDGGGGVYGDIAACACADASARQLCMDLQQRRSLRKAWLQVAETSATCGREVAVVSSHDVTTLLQMSADCPDNLQVAEMLEMLTDLLYTYPASVYPVFVKARGGTRVVLSILQRHARHVHVQVAAFHLLGGLLSFSFGSQEHFRPGSKIDIKGLFMALQDTLSPHAVTEPVYHALMEVIMGLPPGSIGYGHACQMHLDLLCKRNGLVTVHIHIYI
jgi:hypothetical protein